MALVPADDAETSDSGSEAEEETNYDLIGVTVHTGTADGGHYYSFIRDRLSQNEMGHDEWSVPSGGGSFYLKCVSFFSFFKTDNYLVPSRRLQLSENACFHVCVTSCEMCV